MAAEAGAGAAITGAVRGASRSSTIGQVVMTLFSALAFSGSGFLFQKLDRNGFNAETRRHNLAVEALAKRKEDFLEARAIKADRVAKLEKESREAREGLARDKQAIDQMYEAISASQLGLKGEDVNIWNRLTGQQKNEKFRIPIVYVAIFGVVAALIVALLIYVAYELIK